MEEGRDSSRIGNCWIGCNPVRALLNLPKCRCSTVPISNAIAKMYSNCGIEPILAVIRKHETRTSGNGRLGQPHCGLRQISTFEKVSTGVRCGNLSPLDQA